MSSIEHGRRDNPPFITCEVCGRAIDEHVIFHDEPPAGHGLTEATFAGIDVSGFYCPKRDDDNE